MGPGSRKKARRDDNALRGTAHPNTVIPAKAGIQATVSAFMRAILAERTATAFVLKLGWVPASVGMTSV
ncbi:MAG: hypothetical protein JSR89_04240 [Proteobacteria bacterium]|nr:hypothetical protein [Pseudomonadota bacterium]